MEKDQIGKIIITTDGDVCIMSVSDNRTEYMKLYEPYDSFSVTYTNHRERGVLGHGRFRPTEWNVPTQAARAWYALMCRRSHTFRLCDEWLNFQVFADWYYRQLDRYADWWSLPFKWSMTHKLIDPTNQGHDPITCCIVPSPFVRMIFAKRTGDRGLPMGVHLYGDRYRAVCTEFGAGQRYLGTFDSIDEASAAYWSVKCDSIRKTTERYRPWLPTFLADRFANFDREMAKMYFPA